MMSAHQPWPTRPVPLAARLRPRSRSSIHRAECSCIACRELRGPAPTPAAAEISGQAIAAWSIAGAAVGLVLARAIDWLAGVHAFAGMFGAFS